MIKDVMERDMINEISTLFVMIFTSGLMFVMPILDIGYNDILVIICNAKFPCHFFTDETSTASILSADCNNSFCHCCFHLNLIFPLYSY